MIEESNSSVHLHSNSNVLAAAIIHRNQSEETSKKRKQSLHERMTKARSMTSIERLFSFRGMSSTLNSSAPNSHYTASSGTGNIGHNDSEKSSLYRKGRSFSEGDDGKNKYAVGSEKYIGLRYLLRYRIAHDFILFSQNHNITALAILRHCIDAVLLEASGSVWSLRNDGILISRKLFLNVIQKILPSYSEIKTHNLFSCLDPSGTGFITCRSLHSLLTIPTLPSNSSYKVIVEGLLSGAAYEAYYCGRNPTKSSKKVAAVYHDDDCGPDTIAILTTLSTTIKLSVSVLVSCLRDICTRPPAEEELATLLDSLFKKLLGMSNTTNKMITTTNTTTTTTSSSAFSVNALFRLHKRQEMFTIAEMIALQESEQELVEFMVSEHQHVLDAVWKDEKYTASKEHGKLNGVGTSTTITGTLHAVQEVNHSRASASVSPKELSSAGVDGDGDGGLNDGVDEDGDNKTERTHMLPSQVNSIRVADGGGNGGGSGSGDVNANGVDKTQA